MRIVLGIIAGVVVFALTLAALEFVAHQLFPSRGGLLPIGLLVFVAVAYFVSALLGGVTAGRISRAHWTVWVIAVLVAAGAAYSLTTISHPVWMQIASIAAPLLGGLVASRLVPAGTDARDARA